MASDSLRVRALVRALSTAVLASALAATTHPALAAPTNAEKEHARDLMAQGRERRDGNDLTGALKSFQEADAIMHVPTTALEVARTQHALSQYLEALETLAALQKLPASASDPPPFVEARQKASALAAEIAEKVPTLKIVVTGAESPEVTIDDRAVPSLEEPVKVNPGKHAIVARAGGAEQKTTITLGPGDARQVELSLDTKDAPATASQEGSRGIPTLSWIGFGVGAAGLLAGSITGVMALSQESELADRCANKSCPPTAEGDLDSAKTMATISTIGFVVAVVGAAVGVVGIVTGKPAAKATTAVPARGLRVRLAGSGIGGTF